MDDLSWAYEQECRNLKRRIIRATLLLLVALLSLACYRWEYRIVTMLARSGLPLARVLNDYARQGWEYCASERESKTGGTCRVLLRRPWQPCQLTADEIYEKVYKINEALGGKFVNEHELSDD